MVRRTKKEILAIATATGVEAPDFAGLLADVNLRGDSPTISQPVATTKSRDRASLRYFPGCSLKKRAMAAVAPLGNSWPPGWTNSTTGMPLAEGKSVHIHERLAHDSIHAQLDAVYSRGHRILRLNGRREGNEPKKRRGEESEAGVHNSGILNESDFFRADEQRDWARYIMIVADWEWRRAVWISIVIPPISMALFLSRRRFLARSPAGVL